MSTTTAPMDSGWRLADLLKRREAVLAFLLVSMMLLIGLRAPVFLSQRNLDSVLTDSTILVMLAAGQMLVIMTRGIDLSVASNLALSGMVAALVQLQFPGLPIAVPIAAAMLVGLTLGAFNGLLVAYVRIPPIVVTLGTMSIYRGLIFVMSGGGWVTSNQMTDIFLNLPRMRILGLTTMVWCAALIVILVYVFLRHTRYGRELYAVGGNPVAARYLGIDLAARQFMVYCLSGLIAGLCGYLWVARYAIAYTELALAFELQVVAACVIGGISIAGGVGTLAGAVLGALFLSVIYNALPVINVSPFWQMAIAGIVILVAVAINARDEASKTKKILRESYAGSGKGETTAP